MKTSPTKESQSNAPRYAWLQVGVLNLFLLILPVFAYYWFYQDKRTEEMTISSFRALSELRSQMELSINTYRKLLGFSQANQEGLEAAKAYQVVLEAALQKTNTLYEKQQAKRGQAQQAAAEELQKSQSRNTELSLQINALNSDLEELNASVSRAEKQLMAFDANRRTFGYVLELLLEALKWKDILEKQKANLQDEIAKESELRDELSTSNEKLRDLSKAQSSEPEEKQEHRARIEAIQNDLSALRATQQQVARINQQLKLNDLGRFLLGLYQMGERGAALNSSQNTLSALLAKAGNLDNSCALREVTATFECYYNSQVEYYNFTVDPELEQPLAAELSFIDELSDQLNIQLEVDQAEISATKTRIEQLGEQLETGHVTVDNLRGETAYSDKDGAEYRSLTGKIQSFISKLEEYQKSQTDYLSTLSHQDSVQFTSNIPDPVQTHKQEACAAHSNFFIDSQNSRLWVFDCTSTENQTSISLPNEKCLKKESYGDVQTCVQENLLNETLLSSIRSSKNVALSVDLKDIIDESAALLKFNQIALVDETGHVLHQSGLEEHVISRPIGAVRGEILRHEFSSFDDVSNWIQDKDQPEPADSILPQDQPVLVTSSRVFPSIIGGIEYTTFRQPVPNLHASREGTKDEDLYLIGLTRADEFRSSALSLSFEAVATLVIIGVIFLFAIPAIRVFFANRHSGLSMHWALILLASLGIVYTLSTMLIVHYGNSAGKNNLLEQQLKGIVKNVRSDFKKELSSQADELSKFGSELRSLDSCEEVVPEQAARHDGSQLPYYKFMYMLDSSGSGIGLRKNLRYTQPQKGQLNVPDRKYFTEVHGGKAPQLSEPKGEYKGQLYLDRIVSYLDSSREAAISIPAPGIIGNGCSEAEVLVMITQMLTTYHAVLPAHTTLLIVDNKTGRALFHSVDGQSATENFFSETDWDENLLVAATNGHEHYGETIYHRKNVAYHIDKLDVLDGFSIVALKDLEIDDSVSFYTLAVAMVWVLVYVLFVSALIITDAIIFRDRLRWLWPQRDNRKHYILISIWMLLTICALTIHLASNSTIALMILLPGVVLLTLRRVLVPSGITTNERKDREIIAIVLLIVIASFVYQVLRINNIAATYFIELLLVWSLALIAPLLASFYKDKIFKQPQRFGPRLNPSFVFFLASTFSVFYVSAAVLIYKTSNEVFEDMASVYSAKQVDRGIERRFQAMEAHRDLLDSRNSDTDWADLKPLVFDPYKQEEGCDLGRGLVSEGCLGFYAKEKVQQGSLENSVGSRYKHRLAELLSPFSPLSAELLQSAKDIKYAKDIKNAKHDIVVESSFMPELVVSAPRQRLVNNLTKLQACMNLLPILVMALITSIFMIFLSRSAARVFLGLEEIQTDFPKRKIDELDLLNRSTILVTRNRDLGQRLSNAGYALITDLSQLSEDSAKSYTKVYIDDPEKFLIKRAEREKFLKTLEAMQANNCTIITAIEVSPSYWLTQFSSKGNDDLTLGNEEVYRWSRILSKFVVERLVYTGSAEPYEQQAGLDEATRSLLNREVSQFSDLRDQADNILRRIIERQQSEHRLDGGEVITELVRIAAPFYQRVWSLSTSDEKVQMYTLANGDFINGIDTETLQSLQMRGLITREYGSYQFANESLKQYVARNTDPNEIRNYLPPEGSAWRTIWPSIMVVVLIIFGGVFLLGGNAFQSLISTFGSIIASLPVMLGVLSAIRSFQSPSSS